MKMTKNIINQRGAVSLFIVIFSALLITIVSISFVGIMIQDQQQASTTDLSQSAYDSAQAGVEDAKRALIRYQNMCGSDSNCVTSSKINASTCNTAVEELSDVKDAANSSSNGEVAVQTGGSNSLDQAYTCVKISLDTIDYLGSLSANKLNVIPLTSVDQFDTIQIQWFSSSDFSSTSNFNIDLQNPAQGVPLLAQNSWKQNRPSIMQSQLIQFGSNGFTLNDFDSKNASGQVNANTLFLYPSGTTGVANSTIDTYAFGDRDIRMMATGAPLPVTCSGNLVAGGYACTAKLTLPVPINGGDRTAYLQLKALYNNSSYRVTLLNGTVPVKFNAVQPEVDSTGRANDLFRRVQARVMLSDLNFPYPRAAVDVSGGLCKDFIVTDNVADYKAGSCTP
jgi:Tfp pilus assembly protein PilX